MVEVYSETFQKMSKLKGIQLFGPKVDSPNGIYRPNSRRFADVSSMQSVISINSRQS